MISFSTLPVKHAVLFLLLVALAAGCTQQAPQAKVYRVGVLNGLDFFGGITDGFKEQMTELGYEEGTDIVYDEQVAPAPLGNQAILQKFVDDDVDLILTFPTEATIEAKQVTQGTGIPVVFGTAIIEDVGIVNSVREPGGDITGVRYPGPDIAIQRLEVMLELAPGAGRILVPYQRGYPIVPSQLEVLYPAAAALNVTLIEAPADNAEEMQALLANVSDIDAILMIVEPLAVTPEPFAAMAGYAYGNNIPVGGAMMAAGGYESLYGISTDPLQDGKQAAVLADKIFRGTPAGTIPVVTAESYLTLNFKATQQMGIAVSESLLGRASEIIR